MSIRISVKAKTGAKIEKVVKTGEGEYTVAVSERPVDGKANSAIIEALAKHFSVSKSQVVLVSGGTSKIKIFELFM